MCVKKFCKKINQSKLMKYKGKARPGLLSPQLPTEEMAGVLVILTKFPAECFAKLVFSQTWLNISVVLIYRQAGSEKT